MITFLCCFGLLIIGYVFYGRLIDKIFGLDERPTPAVSVNDGADYIPMPTWKVFLIQLLNIAGTGPIFGALSGAVFGPIVYLWITGGCIFAGAVHDYMCGMLSCRNKGVSISEIVGMYLGNKMKYVMRIFSIVLLVMCGVVFTTGPADLLAMLIPNFLNKNMLLWIILIYYFVATFVPIDKILGRLYPVFGVCLIIMAVGTTGSLMFWGDFHMPELWNNFGNMHPTGKRVFPFMFVTVACGAISGFHATQSPMMARCLKTEKDGRKVFYGAMIAEGIIALIWAAAGVTCYDTTQELLAAGGGCSSVVYNICQTTMGKVGGILALVGVIICPISSGDTAFRSARLTISDCLKIDQKSKKNRIYITAPLLLVGAFVCYIDYSVVWRYFAWANQALATITLWAMTAYLKNEKRNFLITLIPAIFMTTVSVLYFIIAPECLGAIWM